MRGSPILRDCGGEAGIGHERNDDERDPKDQYSCPMQDLIHGPLIKFTMGSPKLLLLELLNHLLKPALRQSQPYHSHLLTTSAMKSFQGHKCRLQRAVCQHWNHGLQSRLQWRTYASGRLKKHIDYFITRVRLPSSSRPTKNLDEQ